MSGCRSRLGRDARRRSLEGRRRTIALLHAGVCDRRCWRDVGERLGAAGRDVVAYDRRGFGDVPPADGALPARRRPAGRARRRVARAPAWVVGSSMGGGVALDAALEAPERVAGLVLLAPAISGDPGPGDEAYDAATGGLADAIDAAFTSGRSTNATGSRSGCGSTGRPGRTGRVSGPARELALDMNRIVIANEVAAEAPTAPTGPADSTPRAACTRSRSRRSSPAASSTSRSRSAQHRVGRRACERHLPQPARPSAPALPGGPAGDRRADPGRSHLRAPSLVELRLSGHR